MNKILTKEIIKHIFSVFNVPHTHNAHSYFVLMSNDFLLNKHITFMENDITHQHKIWGAETKIINSSIRILLTDCSDRFSQEYYMIIRMDDFPIFSLKMMKDTAEEDYRFLILIKNNEIKEELQIEADIASQAKILAGIEQLYNTYTKWEKPAQYDDMYNTLITLIETN